MSVAFVSSASAVGVSTAVVSAPTGIVSGNLLVAVLYVTNTSAPTWSGPSGWTQLVDHHPASAAGESAIYLKTATGSEPSTYSFSSGAGSCVAIVHQFSGAATSDVTVPSWTDFATSTTSWTAASVTASAGQYLVCLFGNSGVGLNTLPTGMTQLDQREINNSYGLYTFGQSGLSAGATGTKSSTSSSGATGLTGSFLIGSSGSGAASGSAALTLSASGTSKGSASGSGALSLSATGSVAFTVSATPSSSSVALSWAAQPGAVSYAVERDGALIAYNISGTTFTDTGVTSGSHTYRVAVLS